MSCDCEAWGCNQAIALIVAEYSDQNKCFRLKIRPVLEVLQIQMLPFNETTN